MDRARALRAAGLAAAWLTIACGPDVQAPPLPEPPELEGLNVRSLEAFRTADSAAREGNDDPESVGELGMLYHAYQLFDLARPCYERARALEPDAFRWVYYQAMLEKSAFQYRASESLFRRALEMRPESAELRAELGDLYLMWGRRDEARELLEEALELDPSQPVAALGKARLLTIGEDWRAVVELLEPLLTHHPRLSQAHKFLAAAYGALDKERKRAKHQELGEYGSLVESPLMAEVHDLAVEPILDGDPARGPELLQTKCARCHDHERIYDRDETRFWWGRTVRRMQREAGLRWLTDEEAAAVVAYLSER